MAFLVVIGILIIALVNGVIEVPTLLKQKQKKELWMFSILLLLAVGLGAAVTLHINLPNPFDTITAIYKPLNDYIFRLLQ
ncbi:hypothetical protein [Ammoniphilus resinae]|uniref:Uncharacterized membrane protein HdeD (DUF308 family) n=1 Tax=Ammoniphilus resinae TaxID=861532 RepID=A0ABS4GPA2_9BACL|nr:hypothetical protein [Ammoniphilus resinae]MBP1932103.1 uncharacterized membrane protein HdeD (DUF308 family) [Ammoniphilus resinae]